MLSLSVRIPTILQCKCRLSLTTTDLLVGENNIWLLHGTAEEDDGAGEEEEVRRRLVILVGFWFALIFIYR